MYKLTRKVINVLVENDIRRQFVIAMVLVAILPLLILSVALYYYNAMPLLTSFINQNRNLLEQQMVIEQAAKTRDLAHELAGFFDQVEIHASVLASVADNETLPRVYRQAVLRDYLERFPRILWMRSSHGIQIGETDTAMQNLFDAATSGGMELFPFGKTDMRVSTPLQIPSHSDESLIIVSVPSIYGVDSRITLLVELPSVESLTGQTVSAEMVFVVDDRGTLILKSEALPYELGRNMAELGIIREFVRNGTVNRSFSDKMEDGLVYRGVLSRVENVNWGVVTQRDPANLTGVMLEMESAASDVLNRLAFATVVGLVSVGLLAGALGALVAVRFSKPLRMIKFGIDSVKSGHYEYEFQETGPPDIRQLAQTLNAMMRSLRQSTRDLRAHADAMTEMFMGSVTAMVAAIDAKDPYTRGHSRRVQAISTAIGRQMGLDDTQIRELEISALMHDIGKLGIDESLLRKPGLLTSSERKALEQHPVFGAQIMRHIPMFQNMLPGMLHHHERWDGSGYPDGLTGESIPLYGRIIAVADTFDAMTSSRPYQETLTPDEARELISNWSGTRYDPVVVHAFLKQFDAICEICDALTPDTEKQAANGLRMAQFVPPGSVSN